MKNIIKISKLLDGFVNAVNSQIKKILKITKTSQFLYKNKIESFLKQVF